MKKKWQKLSIRKEKKRQVNAGADDAVRTAQIEKRKAARSSHSKSQSRISHQDHLEAHETKDEDNDQCLFTIHF